VDAKIAARLNGMLEHGAATREVIGSLENLVGVVLRPSEFATLLERKLQEVEEEIAERKLTARAKAKLQCARGMSEEQAHRLLRAISRKSRRPLREIAREVIEERNFSWNTAR
jgi:AmiR/NasT family two-component response regulator